MWSKRVIRFAISGIALGGFTIAPLLAVAQDAPAVPEPESVSIENTVVCLLYTSPSPRDRG